MSKKDGKRKELQAKNVNNIKEEPPMLQTQMQQQYVKLQTVLILTQLNSAYYKMHLALIKNVSNVENKYFSLKMAAFLSLANYKSHTYEAQTKLANCKSLQTTECNSILYEPSLTSDTNALFKIKNRPSIIVLQSISDTKNKVFINTKRILKKMVNILTNKAGNILCLSFYQLIRTSKDNSTIKMLSEKSSKIQTIDSQKSKVFKRSLEKRVSRKSFSLQKSIKDNKNQYFVPIKYQAHGKVATPPILSNQSSSIQESKMEEAYMTNFARFLQKTPDPMLIDRRNLLSANRQRKIQKSTSSKKYNVSVFAYGKQQKVRQLQYLERKYKKLIAQFNWFSERFLKVIEEEAI